MAKRPDLSVIVVFHNMTREAPRTLFTLSRQYQKNIEGLEFEVIALDNGSKSPLSSQLVESVGPEFKYEYFDTDSVSPVEAVNRGVALSQADHVVVLIDGAHMITPGVFAGAMRAFKVFDDAFVVTLPMHLGPGLQNITITQGYTKAAEDASLASVDWKADGYKLFDIAGSVSGGNMGWFGLLLESSCFAIRKDTYLQLGGFDPKFVAPGGGLVAIDFFRQAVGDRAIEYVMLFGEASFHQLHGGVASNAPMDAHPWAKFHQEYESIRGEPFAPVARRPFFMGALSSPALRIAKWSAENGIPIWENLMRERQRKV